MRTLDEYRALVEERLNRLFPEKSDRGAPILNAAMRYSVLAGGKRLRPAMLLAAVEMLGGEAARALDFACAVEMIHTYSLIHDDLPGMDDDSLRRGRPTNHVVFGVGQAILAGDGLLSYAVETMLDCAARAPGDEARALAAIREIVKGAGAFGMVAGQSLDLASERDGVAAPDREDMLVRIQGGKCACMFIHPLRAAVHLAGAGEAALKAMTEYGRAFGMLFQATDDVLDVTSSADELGKSVGKDEKSGKLTCISVYGLDGTRERIQREYACALRALSPFGKGADFFREMVDRMVSRTK